MASRRPGASGMRGPTPAPSLLLLAALLLACVVVFVAANERTPRAFSTTFHVKNNQKNQSQTPPPKPEPKGKLCTKHADCEVIRNTSCRVDRSDGRHRCMCIDKSLPVNGMCHPQYVGLRWSCSENKDCLPHGECAMPNATLSNATATGKICQCKAGYSETEDEECSGACPWGGSLRLLTLAGVAVFCLAASF